MNRFDHWEVGDLATSKHDIFDPDFVQQNV